MEVSTFGGSGFIGSYLHESLRREGYKLRAYSRSDREGYRPWNYNALPEKHELTVFLSSESNRSKVNMEKLSNMEDRLAGLRFLVRESEYFVFISSCVVYGYDSCEFHHVAEELSPKDPYSLEKLASEAVVIQNGGLVLRLSNLFGGYFRYRGTITEDILAQCQSKYVQALSLRNYDAILDFIHVDSVVQIILKSLSTRSQGIFNVASGQSVSLLQLLDLASMTSGKPLDSSVPTAVSPRKMQLLDISNTVLEFSWRPPLTVEMLQAYFSLRS